MKRVLSIIMMSVMLFGMTMQASAAGGKPTPDAGIQATMAWYITGNNVTFRRYPTISNESWNLIGQVNKGDAFDSIYLTNWIEGHRWRNVRMRTGAHANTTGYVANEYTAYELLY